MYQNAVVIINPSSGKEKAESQKEIIHDTLKQVAKKIVFKETKKAGDATDFAKAAVKEAADLVVCLGGDGTVNEVVTGLVTAKKPPILAIIPMGTVNSLALALNLPTETKKAIKVLTSRQSQKIDVGRVNDHYFTNVIALGDIASGIRETSVAEKSEFGPFAYAIKGVKEFMKQDAFLVKIKTEDTTWQGEVMIVAAVLTSVLGSAKHVFENARVDDGKMQLFVIKDLSVANVLKMLPELLTKQYNKSENVQHWQVSKAHVTGDTSLEGNIDGDGGPGLPWELEVLPQKLEVLVPEKY